MWSTAVLALALGVGPAQAEGLTLTNVRSTHGILGPVRADRKLLPGDALYLRFNIEGITTDANGKALYSMATEVTNSDGKLIFRQEPKDLETVNALGGTSMPGFAQVNIGLDQPPGLYSLKVTVTDRSSGKSQAITRPFEVLPPEFGIVRLITSIDPEGIFQGSVFEAGEVLWVHGGVTGFQRDPATRQPRLGVEVRVLDEAGKPTVPQAHKADITRDVPEDVKVMTGRFVLALNRPGKFTVEITTTDKVAGKTAKISFPLVVTPPAGAASE